MTRESAAVAESATWPDAGRVQRGAWEAPRHLLMVAFHYPPEASSSGVLRTLKFSRYLPEFGWRVSVLTVAADAYEQTDAGLEAQIPGSVRVLRTRYLNTKRHLALGGIYPSVLAIPDRWVGWYPWALAAGQRLFAADPPDAVFSTSPHPTAHLIAGRLARRHARPWIMDFRDPWYEEPPEPDTPATVHRAARWLERRAVHAASRIVASTPGLARTLATRYPDLPGERFTAVVNGYDEADFAELPAPAERDPEHLTLIHAGNINLDYRDPRPLFRAIARAGARGDLDASRLRVRCIAPGAYCDSDAIAGCLAETGLEAQVRFEARRPYAELLAELGAADALLLLQASEDTRDLVPAKLYEYLRAGRPVLALVEPGAVGEVMSRTGGGWAVDPRDTEALEAAVTDLFVRWREGRLDSVRADREALAGYTRRSLTGELGAILDRAAGVPCR